MDHQTGSIFADNLVPSNNYDREGVQMNKFNASDFNIYTLDKDAEKSLWSDCVFVFDTSSLLTFYELSKETHESIVKVFEVIGNRLWIPYHVQFEFQKNRKKSIDGALKLYEEFNRKNIRAIEMQIETMKNDLLKMDPRHHLISPQISFNEKQLVQLTTQFTQLKEQLVSLKNSKNEFKDTCKKLADARHKDVNELFINDVIIEIIKEHFMVGNKYIFNKIIEIAIEGSQRYLCSIPPGFKDAYKKGTQRYGDLIIWKQIIDFAVKSKKNIVFITNDISKEDWGVVRNKHFQSPLFDLITEFFDASGKRFWIYTLGDFLSKADELLGVKVPEDQLAQVNQTLTEDISVLAIKYQCNKCKRIGEDTIDAGELELEVIDSFERGMGIERQYEDNTEISCPYCDNPISVHIIAWEYPEGSPIAIDVELEGAKLLWSSDHILRNDDHWDDLCHDRYIDHLISEMKDG